MGGNESPGREHAKMTSAMGWTQRKRQTKEEVGSQFLYSKGGGGPTKQNFEDFDPQSGCASATDLALGGRQNVIITPRHDEDAETNVARAVCNVEGRLPGRLPHQVGGR